MTDDSLLEVLTLLILKENNLNWNNFINMLSTFYLWNFFDRNSWGISLQTKYYFFRITSVGSWLFMFSQQEPIANIFVKNTNQLE